MNQGLNIFHMQVVILHWKNNAKAQGWVVLVCAAEVICAFHYLLLSSIRSSIFQLLCDLK